MADPGGPAQVTGAAKYTADIVRPGMLSAKIVRCPHAHARITRIDTSAARDVPGVKAVQILQGVGAEIQWALDEIVLVAAATEEQAEDAARAVIVEYEVLPHHVDDLRLTQAPQTRPGPEEAVGDPDKAMAEAAVRFKGTYGLPAVAHSCLEPHGSICEWNGARDTLTAHCSTQAVSAVASELSKQLDIPASNVHVVCQYLGGGFGSKLGADPWDIACAETSRQAGGVPVRLMLERDAELAVAGHRPSAYAEIVVGAAADGTLVSWISKSWGSGGLGDAGHPPLPYIFQIPNRKQSHTSIPTHTASARPWCVPNHPQACFLTLSALDDLAARLGIDPLALVRKNQAILGPLARVWMEELDIADRLMDWSARWKPRGSGGKGPVKRGLGLSLHTWENVGGVQMAEVEVDAETGVVKVRKMVAVQDCGLVADLKTAESQVYGGLILGISSALAEERVVDPVTGTLLNVDFESYKLAGIADVGELVVHLMTGPGYDERGVIGLGETPVISPAAALANAVANALGVRVPWLPLTPQRVLDALEAPGRGLA
jgi:xanthine dehydrogenase YagR molybdenum-binding subunit